MKYGYRHNYRLRRTSRSLSRAALPDVPYGERVLTRGLTGRDVEELQIRLAGFQGTVPDGDFGPATELQVVQFQRDVMQMEVPDGIAGRATLEAIDAFGERFPLDFETLKCPCGVCDGFGQGRFAGEFRSGKPETERNYLYEYPGVHRMLLWAVRAVFWYHPEFEFVITSGYRCGERNAQTERRSTNHHGKAIDLDILGAPEDDKREDMLRCDYARGRIAEQAQAQIGWNLANRKSLEPSEIAPTWVHYDVRCYSADYLEDRFFCATLEELNRKLPMSC